MNRVRRRRSVIRKLHRSCYVQRPCLKIVEETYIYIKSMSILKRNRYIKYRGTASGKSDLLSFWNCIIQLGFGTSLRQLFHFFL